MMNLHKLKIIEDFCLQKAHMATHSGHFIQDQNLNVQLDGASVRGKANISKAQKKGGGLGGRKALNDILNSGKPSALQPSRKHNSLNVISIGEDLSVSKTNKLSVGGKINVSKAPEKAQVGGRKALSDLTNSGKPSGHRVLKNSQGKKLIAVAEEDELPSAVAEERFLHNHQKCIKAQRNMDYFLRTIGLDDDISTQLASPRAFPSNSKPECTLKHLIMEDVSELMIEDQLPDYRKLGLQSAVCESPNSPKPYVHWKDYYNNSFPDFILMESP